MPTSISGILTTDAELEDLIRKQRETIRTQRDMVRAQAATIRRLRDELTDITPLATNLKG